MKKIYILFLMLSIPLLADYLTIDDNPIGIEGNNLVVNNISQSFSTNTLKVGTSEVTHTIPIYLKSNLSDKVLMTVSNLTNLRSLANNEEILTSVFYQKTGSNISPIFDTTPFVLLNENEGIRDGNSLIGMIIIKVQNISHSQTVGEYKLDAKMQVQTTTNTSNMGNLSLKGNVPLVAVAGFTDVSNTQSGQKFNNATINYGVLDFSIRNELKKALFIKSNSQKNFKISLNTSPLTHQVYPSHTIDVNYYYQPLNGEEVLINTNYFIALSGKHDGTQVGEMKFITEEVSSRHLAGDYRATINLTITLE